MTISMKQAPLLQRREQETPIEIETGTAPESPKLSQPVRNWSVAPHCLVTTIWLSLLYASVLVFLVGGSGDVCDRKHVEAVGTDLVFTLASAVETMFLPSAQTRSTDIPAATAQAMQAKPGKLKLGNGSPSIGFQLLLLLLPDK